MPAAPVLSPNTAARDRWLSLIDSADATANVDVFGRERRVDYTRFQPRGRHAGDPARERWFRAYHWLSHVELNIVSRDSRSSDPGLAPDPSPTPREVAVAWALGQLAEASGVALDLGRASDLLDVVVAPRADMPLEAIVDLAVTSTPPVANSPPAMTARSEPLGWRRFARSPPIATRSANARASCTPSRPTPNSAQLRHAHLLYEALATYTTDTGET